MKKALQLVLSFIILLLFSGCCLSHEWEEADCTTAKTCSQCSKTEGEPLGHQWKDATCIDPKTCTSCGATEGDSLGHTFGKENIQDPDYVQATATYVQTCINCEEQTKRQGSLEKLHNDKVFLMSSEAFAERLTNKMTGMQHLLGDEQYRAFVDADKESGNLKLYICQKNAYGTEKIVGEFEMSIYGNRDQVQPEQKNEAAVFWKIHGTVKGKEPRALVMVSLVKTVDPTREDDTKAIHTLSGWQDTPLTDPKTNTYYMPFGDFIVEIQPKGGNTCGLSISIR